jgi:hypothetical protein
MSGRFTRAALLVCCALATRSAVADENLRICNAITTAQSKIRRLLADFYMESREKDTTETDRELYAIDGDRRFLDFVHHTSPNREPWLDPYRFQQWSSWPDTLTTLLVMQRRAMTSTNRLRIDEFRGSPYADCLGWKSPLEAEGMRLVSGRRFYLCDVFDGAQAQKLKCYPERETVEGLACVKITADGGKDTLWICPERGYSLVRRIWEPTSADQRRVEYRCRDFTQVEPGIWLPKSCDGLIETADRASSRSFQMKVVHLAVNESVPKEMFEPTYPPGTQILDTRAQLVKSIPGGTDLLDLWIAVACKLFPPRNSSLHEANWDLARSLVGTLLLLIGIFMPIVVKSLGHKIESKTQPGAKVGG